MENFKEKLEKAMEHLKQIDDWSLNKHLTDSAEHLESAGNEIEEASKEANEAYDYADEALDKAKDASNTADEAATKADEARDAANDAKASADRAYDRMNKLQDINTSALSLLSDLSETMDGLYKLLEDIRDSVPVPAPVLNKYKVQVMISSLSVLNIEAYTPEEAMEKANNTAKQIPADLLYDFSYDATIIEEIK